METPQSFSTSEVAQYCHVTADTIRKWAEAGKIKVFKTPGGHRRIRREDLIRFLRENNMPIHEDLDNSGSRVLIVDDEKAVLNGQPRLSRLRWLRTASKPANRSPHSGRT